MQKTCIIIMGPTAIGKTSLAIEVAQHYGTEIISCDSRQCYKELKIGVARPSEAELNSVLHHFIDSHSIHDEVNAAVFEKYALEKIEQIFKTKDVAVMVGGTGLYINAFCQGLDAIPSIDIEIRKKIIEQYENHGIEWLHNELNKHDVLFATKGEMKNPQRMMRALEVLQQTGKSIITFQEDKKVERPFRIAKFSLEMPREELYARINRRADMMMNQGQLEEAKGLLEFEHLNALQTVGYSELFDYFNGECSLDDAINLIKQKTRNYAKRQVTWFKKDSEAISLTTQTITQAGVKAIADIVSVQSSIHS